MSSDDELSPAQEAADEFLWNCLLFVAPALIYYDTLLTLPTEIKVIWNRKLRVAALFYVMARYSLVIQLTLDVVVYLSSTSDQVKTHLFIFSDRTCTNLWHADDIFWIFALVGMEGLQIARAYAISQQSNRTLIVLCCLFLGVIVPQIYVAIIDRCSDSVDDVIFVVTTISSAFLVVLETAVLSVTTYHTLWAVRLAGGGLRTRKGSLTDIFLKQGIVYYIFVLTFMLTSMVLDAKLPPDIAGLEDSIPNVLSVIIICRFLLEIRTRNLNIQVSNSSGSQPGQAGDVVSMTYQVKRAVVEEFSDETLSRNEWALGDVGLGQRGEDAVSFGLGSPLDVDMFKKWPHGADAV